MSSRTQLIKTRVFNDVALQTLLIPHDVDEGGGDADLRRLLELACDWYWTLDSDYRLVRLDGRQLDDGPNVMRDQLGRRPWEWAGVIVDAPGFTQLHESLLDRIPFYERECTMEDGHGLLRHLVISGEPLFDNDRFIGFHGTTRDLTLVRRTAALASLEHAVGRIVAMGATSRQVLQGIMKAVCDSEQWETAGYFRLANKQGPTRLVAGWSALGAVAEPTESHRRTASKVIKAGESLDRVVATGKPLWVDRPSRTSTDRRAKSNGEPARFYLPIVLGGAVNGVFAFVSAEIREPDERLLEALRVVGEQAGQFLRRKEAEQILLESEARFRALTKLSSDWYWEMDAELRLTRVEIGDADAAAALPGPQSIGKRIWETGLQLGRSTWSAYSAQLESRLPFRDVEMLDARRPEQRRYISISGEPVLDRHGAFVGYRGVGRDISERKEAELRIRYVARHDGLTGLANRMRFSELLTRALHASKASGCSMALLFVDLDGFKSVNDTLGHAAGDLLLQETARRLSRCLRSTDVVARLGGDEFVVLLSQMAGADPVGLFATRLLAVMSEPVVLCGAERCVTASIGISLLGVDANTERDLMKNADIAMYRVKNSGKNGYCFFSDDPA